MFLEGRGFLRYGGHRLHFSRPEAPTDPKERVQKRSRDMLMENQASFIAALASKALELTLSSRELSQEALSHISLTGKVIPLAPKAPKRSVPLRPSRAPTSDPASLGLPPASAPVPVCKLMRVAWASLTQCFRDVSFPCPHSGTVVRAT